MIENKLLSEELEWQRHHKQRIGRIVSKNHVEPVPDENVTRKYETRHCEIKVLDRVPRNGLQLQQAAAQLPGPAGYRLFEEFDARQAVDTNAADHFVPGLVRSPQRNNGDLIARRLEQRRFIPYASV